MASSTCPYSSCPVTVSFLSDLNHPPSSESLNLMHRPTTPFPQGSVTCSVCGHWRWHCSLSFQRRHLYTTIIKSIFSTLRFSSIDYNIMPSPGNPCRTGRNTIRLLHGVTSFEANFSNLLGEYLSNLTSLLFLLLRICPQ